MTIIVTEHNTEAAVVPAAVDQTVAKTSKNLPATALGWMLAPRGDRRGITTIEYVIGIVAGITIVGVLVLALSNPAVQKALVHLLEHIFGMGNSAAPGVTPGKK